MSVPKVRDIRRPVVDARPAVRRTAGIVQMEGRLRGRAHGGRGDVRMVVLRGVLRAGLGPVVEEVTGVVEHDVLHQVHPPRVKRPRQGAIVRQAAPMRIHLLEMFGPVAVVARVVARRVDPLVGHRRRDPHRRGPQALDVIEAAHHAAQVASVVVRLTPRLELASALVVVARVTIVESVDHQKVQHLVAPVRRGHVQTRCLGRRRACAGTRQTHQSPHPTDDGRLFHLSTHLISGPLKM